MKISSFSFVLIVVVSLFFCVSQPGIAKDTAAETAIALDTWAAKSGNDVFHRKPDYDSGWTSIEADAIKLFQHDLGGDSDDYLVDLQFKDTNSYRALGVNQDYYGSSEFIQFGPPGGRISEGAYWFGLTNKVIRVKRLLTADSHEVRVRIWITPAADYESGWIGIEADGGLKEIEHNLLGDPHDYIVDMQFKDIDQYGLGVHQFRYGMNYTYMGSFDLFPESTGALWSNLGSESIWVARGKDDEVVHQLRIRIWEVVDPNYDSGWMNLEKGKTKSFTHNLGGNPDHYVVDFQFYDSKYSGMGINHQYFGGNEFTTSDGMTWETMGASWSNLTNTGISIQRRSNDASAPEGRIRIWAFDPNSTHLYLPIVSNNH
jgi:hypothetical protein